ncbi:MAG TPA: DUF4157 domain-containing protein [Pyrinomonadaceae bacterium]|jgi:hypothetical protein
MSERAQNQLKRNTLASTSVSSSILQRKCACGMHTAAGDKCDECKNKQGALRRKSSDNSEHMEAPPIVHDVLRSSGQPLDQTTRAFFEPRFGHDFSKVRVHTDTLAGESAGAVNAAAYTVGRDIVFGRGHYAPNTVYGQQLMAHELTHVTQQRNFGGFIPHNLKIGPVHDRFEQEAHAMSQSVEAKPQAVKADSALPTPHIQRGILSAIGGFFSGIGRAIARLFGSENYTKQELEAYLQTLRTTNQIENNYDSDNKARAVVHRRNEFPALTTGIKTLLIREMLSGATLGADEAAILELLRTTTAVERASIVSNIGRERIWEDFSGANRRAIEAITLTAADFSRNDVVERLKSMPRDELTEYRDQAVDPDVRTNIDRILAMQNITTPLGINTNFTAAGAATLTINGFEVTVLPDEYNAPVAQDMAFTSIQLIANNAQNVMHTTQSNQVVSFNPPPPIRVEIQTRYQISREQAETGRAGYGRGTTEEDRESGNTSLRFHESRHGLDGLEFLRNNPPPQFTGAVGMTLEQFTAAMTAYREAVAAYQNRMQIFSLQRSDCPGTPIGAQHLQVVGAPITICTDLQRAR